MSATCPRLCTKLSGDLVPYTMLSPDLGCSKSCSFQLLAMKLASKNRPEILGSDITMISSRPVPDLFKQDHEHVVLGFIGRVKLQRVEGGLCITEHGRLIIWTCHDL